MSKVRSGRSSGAARVPPTRARVVVDSAGTARATPTEFFDRNPALVDHARAARRLDLDGQRYLWVDAGRVWRVDLEVATARSGTIAALHAERAPAPHGLTARELGVLALVAGGLTNAEISERLGTSRRTVATHVERILTKTGQRTRSGAAALALGQGLLVLPLPADTALDALPLKRLSEAAETPARPAPPPARRPPAKRPVHVGSVYPLSGPGHEDGQAMRKGARLAIEEINARGGIDGRPVEHVVVGVDLSDPDRHVPAVERLLASDVDAITLGYVAPTQQGRMLTQAAESGIPLLHTMVSPVGSALVRAEPRLSQTFQICASEDAYLSGFVRTITHLRDTGQWRPHSDRVVLALRETAGPPDATLLEAAGWELSATVAVPSMGADWAAVLADIHRHEPAAILVTSYVDAELRAFLTAFAADPSPSLLYTAWAPSVPGFLARCGTAAEGLLWSTVIGTYDDAIGSAFNARYERSTAAEPGQASAGIHYDMVHLLASAWRQASRPWAHAEVADAIRGTTFRGVAGAYHFTGPEQRGLAYPDDTRDPSLAHAHLVYQVRDGRHRLIAPPEYATDRFLPPHLPG